MTVTLAKRDKTKLILSMLLKGNALYAPTVL